MKTEFDKRSKHSINNLLFGKPKKKYAKYYVALAVLIPILVFLIIKVIQMF